MQHSISQDNTSSDTKLTRVLLLCGVVAGPLYILVGGIEMLTRPGFDPTRHDLSLMSNGNLGWIHISLLILTGLLTCAGAGGMRRVLHGSRGGTWGPLLVGLYGPGLIGAGFFIADPAHGFPPGTPADAHAVSWHGLLHFVSGGIGFLGLIAACFVFARRFAAQRLRGWAVYSNVSEKELAERMGVQRPTVTRLFNASHPNPTLDTIADILRALGLQAEIKISPASPEDAPIPIKATFVPD